MLTDYDADAVAEVMGIAFVPSAEGGPSPAARTRATKAGPVILVGGNPVRVVEARARKAGLRSALFPFMIEKAVEQGLPRAALRHVAEWLAGDDRARVASLEWGVVPKTTLERRATQLSPQESERTERVARLFVHALRALGSEAEARAFMTTTHPLLDGRSPLDACRTDLGTRRVEQILKALEYGLAL